MLGSIVPGCDRATLLDSRLIVLWGMNPAETWMGPNTGHFIAGARERGARVVLIDPRYTDSGILADQWVPIRPGTDAALAAALAYVIESEGLVDRPFMAACTHGYDLYRAWLLGDGDGIAKTPEWADPITGVPARVARQLALDMATSKPMALLPGWGPQRTAYGEQIARAWIALACLTGNVGIRGGGLASIGTRSGNTPLRSLPEGPYRAARAVSASVWATHVLDHTLRPPIKMAYIVATNLINRSPDTRANALALDQFEFVVVNEQFLTPTARRADIILPICTDLERSDLVTSWGHDSHLFYSRQAVPCQGESRTDYWVFTELAERLGFGHDYTGGRSQEEWLRYVLETEGLDQETLRQDGILRTDSHPRVALSEFREDPAAHPLPTPSGLIEIANSQAMAYGLPVIPSYVPDDAAHNRNYPLQIVTPHSKLRSNSCGHANPWLRELETHTVWINPVDAKTRGITEGDLVDVSSPSGMIAIESRVTERIMPGVVCVYQGTWYEPDEGHTDRGGCANVLTSHRLSPTGGSATHSAWVEVRKRT
jgi:anaerobic dimethyl sulfoxide reductase subunit A